jgi:hypothetical protein
MFISTSCPTCGVTGEVPREYVGMTVRCKKCGKSFAISMQPMSARDSVAPAAVVAAPVPVINTPPRRPLVDMAEILMDLPGRDDGSMTAR